jgi:3-dehydroquinate synthase
MKKLKVKLKNHRYFIYYKKNLLNEDFIVRFCKSISSSIVIITHKKIENLYGKVLLEKFSKNNVKIKLLSFEEGEINKNRKTKEYLEDQMLKNNFGKDTLIIALGGGIVSDISGFIASTYMRGISYVIIPTTLLAMVDAAIGGKTAVNISLGKNLIGTIYHPKAVFIDFDVLKTLDKKEIKNGLVEMLKHALIMSKKVFYDLLESREITENQIMKSIKIKRKVIQKDETDSSFRRILNFGHTIAHAIEASLNFQISHGQALAFGILIESHLSYVMNFLPKSQFEKILYFLKKKNLLYSLPEISQERFFAFLKRDKKNIFCETRFVLLKYIGKSINNVGIIKNHIVKSIIFCLEDKLC